MYELFGEKAQLVAMHPEGGHDFPPDVRKAAYAFVDKALRHGERAAESAPDRLLEQAASRPE